MTTRVISKFNCILYKENMWRFILPLMMYIIRVDKSFGMDNHQLCTIHLEPHEHIQLQSDSKLRLICNQSLYETKNPATMEYRNETSLKIDGNAQFLGSKDDMKELVLKNQPAPVKNFQCRSLDFEEWRCTFESTERMPTTYNLTYMIYGHSYECTCTKTNSLYECNHRINRNTHDFYPFVLTSKNCFGTRTETFNLTMLDYVIPGRLKLSTGKVTANTAEILLEMHSKYLSLYERGFDVKLKYKSEYDSSSWKKLRTQQFSELQGKSSIPLDGLFPYTRYDVSVQVKAHKSIKSFDMWRKASIKLRTSQAIPPRPPDIDQGGFKIDKNHCAHVYWKAVPKHQMGAEDFKYGVIITKDGYRIRNTTTTNTKDFVCGKGEYVFSISSQNALGASNESSVLRLRIPDRNDFEDFPKPPGLKSVFNNQMYKLTWSSPKSMGNHSVTNYTVFTCSAKVLDFDSCEDAINFTHLPKNRTNITFTNFENKHLIFAVSANYVNGSSGMETTECTAIENSDLMPLDLKVDTKTNTTLKVEWKLGCVQRSLVVGYILEYCRVDERTEDGSSSESCAELGEISTFSHISPNETDFVLKGLKPFTNYRVQVAMISAMSRGPFSLKVARTSESAPSAPRNLRVCRVYSDGATLQWEVPEYPNGVIGHYDLLLNGKSQNVDDPNIEKKTISYNLTGLSSYSINTIVVVAVTRELKLSGARSNEIVVRTRAGEPGEVRGSTAQTENSKVTVSWRAPADILGPPDSLYYEIQWTHGLEWKNASTNQTSYALTVDSEKDRLFQIRVRAINRVSDDIITSPLCQCSTATFSEIYTNRGERLHYGKWLLVYESSYQPNFTTRIPIIVAIIIVFVLVLVYVLIRKHRKMKSIKLEVPAGLWDIYEESSRPLRPSPKTNYRSNPMSTQMASQFINTNRKFEMHSITTKSLVNDNYPLVRGRSAPTTFKTEQHISVRTHNANDGQVCEDAAIHCKLSSKVNYQPIGKSSDTLDGGKRVDVITERIESRTLTLPPADFDQEFIIMTNLSFEHRLKSVEQPCDITTSIDTDDYRSGQVPNKSSGCEFGQTTNYVKPSDGEKPSSGSIRSSDTRNIPNRQLATIGATYVTMDQLVFLTRQEMH